MFLAGKAVCVGIVFVLLSTGISGPRSTPLPSESNLSKEVPGIAHPNDVIRMQQTLQDKGHYRGKVDGVLGLRTRASIRAYQKAEHLPVTGQIDIQTAGKLGITPEVREETAHKTTQGKPSAGIKWAKGWGKTRKTLRKPASTVTAAEGGRGDTENTLQAGNGNHPQ